MFFKTCISMKMFTETLVQLNGERCYKVSYPTYNLVRKLSVMSRSLRRKMHLLEQSHLYFSYIISSGYVDQIETCRFPSASTP